MLGKITNNIFKDLDIKSCKETFNSFEVYFKCDDFKSFAKKLSKDNYLVIKDSLEVYKYKWDIYVESFEYSISQNNYKLIDLTKNDDNSDIEIVFRITKQENLIVIFDDNVFKKFIEELDLETLLNFFNNKELPIVFKGKDYIIENNFLKSKITSISNQCNFRNHGQYRFSPDFFYLLDKAPEYLKTTFSKLSLLYCWIYLFDSSEIKGNNIKLFISGTKSLRLNFIYPKINEDLLNHYYQIFKWVYSEENKIEDKIGLSRNILTSYLTGNSLKIDNSVFNSILSSNQIYIKGNITKYFEVRGKILEQIERTVQEVNKSIETFVTNFQKSTFVFLSFFLSVFIFKVVNKSDLDKIFTKETSWLGLGFIIISFFYFVASIIIVYLEKLRLDKRYNNVKSRYQDVLIKKDIEKILNEDSEYNDEINHLKNRVLIFSILWVLSLAVFYFVLCYTSVHF